MNIAKLENNVIQIFDCTELFPNTSFPINGPDNNFYTENGCLKISMFKEHDQATQMLVSCDPYEENGVVYTVAIQAKPQEETVIIDLGNGADSI